MVELSNTGAYLVNGSELVFDTPENAARISGECAIGKEEAKKNTKTPTIIEFIIDPEEMVYPMVKPGGTLADLIMDC